MRVAASREGQVQEHVIGFLSHRGNRVAYAVTGNGPPLLMDVGRAHHLEVFWQHAPYRRLVQGLARQFTVIRWDRPGFGLSDRSGMDLSPAGELALVERLAALLGPEPVAILAAGDAGPGMLRFANRHRRRVSRLALFGTAADGRALAPIPPDATFEPLSGPHGPSLHEVVAAVQAAGSEPDVGSWLASALRASADTAAMAALVAAGSAPDRMLDTTGVPVPSLVLHRAGDRVVVPTRGKALAARIGGARFVALEGAQHLPYAGDVDALVAALVPFLGEGVPGRRAALSTRELEVAQLVTLGLTNGQIGRRLTIRRRTVDAHLEHIRAKLGVSSRAQVAAWAAANERTGGIRRGASA